MTWSAVNIGSICETTATTDPRRKPNVSFRYIDISGIDRDLKRIATTAELLGADAPSRARQVVRSKDVLVSTVRPNLNAVTIVPDDLDGEIASTGFCVLRASPRLLEPRFLFYFTRTEQFINALLQHVRGANYPAVTDRNVVGVEIPWPARSEQQRISDVLDQADALRQQRRAADEKAQRILPALFRKLFGDPATNPMGWPVKQLGDVTVGKPQYGANASAVEWSEGKPRYVRITDITDDGRLLKKGVMTLDLADWEPYRLVPGDVLFARSGNTVGKTYLYRPGDGLCAYAGYLIRFKPDLHQVQPWYLFALTQTDYYRAWVDARKRVAGQPNINGKEYASLAVPCPPVPLQKAFAELAEQFVDIRDSREGTGKQIGRLFDLLLHRAFTGELTAGWREARKDQLEAEIQEQLAALEQAKTGKPKRGRKPRSAEAADPADNSRHAGTDMYNKAALVTYIAVKCHNPHRPDSLGRTKLAKLFYLVQRRAEITVTDQFARRAAGPLDDAIHKFLNLAKKQHWLALPEAQGALKPVMPGDDPQPAIDHVRQRWADALAVVDEVLDTMKGWGWRALERWATVENAAQQLAAEGKPVTLAAIKGVIAADPVWRPKLDRPEFADSEIASTLTGLRKHGYLPAGAGANP